MIENRIKIVLYHKKLLVIDGSNFICELLLENMLSDFLAFLADMLLWSYAPFSKNKIKPRQKDGRKNISNKVLIFRVLFRYLGLRCRSPD